MFGILLLHGPDIGAPNCAVADFQDIRHGAGRAVVIASLQLRLSVLFRAGPKRREPSPPFERFERREQKLLITSASFQYTQRAVKPARPGLDRSESA